VQLETERLSLRPLSLDDLDALAELYADPEVMRFMGMGGGGTLDRGKTRTSLERMVEQFEAHGFGQLAVERKAGGSLIGRCGLLVWDTESWRPTKIAEAAGPTEIEVGYLLGRAHWGHGYATEAALAVRDYALGELGLERLIALIYPENTRSIAVAGRLGMEHERDLELEVARLRLYSLGKRPAR
jgi:RimJ/RimL family protein N-acetyltransferase